MEEAKALIRTVARSFYEPEYILIIDAILLHSALRDDDLALLMGMQPKGLRRLVSKLREDGLVAVHGRQEQREGAHRPITKDYYFVDTHRAIDVIKFRIKTMQKKIDDQYGQKVEEKKEFFCPQCKNEYTQLDILPFEMGEMGFRCARCSYEPLEMRQEGPNGLSTSHPGHEVQSRLNAQIAAFETLMRKIDSMQIPDNDFETALQNARPVQRDERLNPAAKTEAVPARLQPETVHGIQQAAEKIEVGFADESKSALEKAAAIKEEERARKAAQNALPAWYTKSTIDGATADPSSQPLLAKGATEETKPVLPKSESGEKKLSEEVKKRIGGGEDDEDDKKKVGDDAALDAYYAAMNEHSESDSDASDSDSDPDSDSDAAKSSNARDDGRPAKRVRIEEPPGSKVNGLGEGATPGGTSADSDEDD